ncbi:phenylacetate--CoA ligase family protein [Candidatus Bipolaricaulota bacterium]
MALGEKARRVAFRLADRVKGAPFEHHLRELDHAQHLSPAELTRWQQQKLYELLRHARDTTRFYSPLIPTRFSPTDGWEILANLPIVDKRIISANLNAFLSSAFTRSRLYSGLTSGSTGHDFEFWMNRARRTRVLAELTYFGGWAGYELGARHLFLRPTKLDSARDFLRLWQKNQILIPSGKLDEVQLDAILDSLISTNAKVLFGYPWTLHVLASHAHRSRKWGSPATLSLRSIVSVGGALLPNTRNFIEKTFKCSVFERYSALEVGTIAGDCEMRRLHLNVGSLYCELLPESREQISMSGGPRNLIVTDLFNYGMPLLRYDLQDKIGLEDGGCPCGRSSPLIHTIYGREMDQLTSPQGEWIDPVSFGNLLRDMTSIRQFQFVQETSNAYQIRVISEDTLDSTTTSEIARRCQQLLGPSAMVQIVQVAEIPALPSGKRPFIVNSMRRGTLDESARGC